MRVSGDKVTSHLRYLWTVLKAASPDTIDQDKISGAITDLFDSVPYPVTEVPPAVYNFYRVREGKLDHLFANVRDFGLAPASPASPQNRCNRKGSQALYFAVTEGTALYEACKTRRSNSCEFHTAYISRWQNVVPIRLAKFLDVRGPFRDRHVRNKHSSDMQLMASLHPDRIHLIRRMLHLLGRCFMARSVDHPCAYTITNIISDQVFKKVDGIYYSSAMRDAHGSNAALRPELLNSAFAFLSVERVDYGPADHVGENYFPKIDRLLGTVVTADGSLGWREKVSRFPDRIPPGFHEENMRTP